MFSTAKQFVCVVSHTRFDSLVHRTHLAHERNNYYHNHYCRSPLNNNKYNRHLTRYYTFNQFTMSSSAGSRAVEVVQRPGPRGNGVNFIFYFSNFEKLNKNNMLL